MVDQKLPENVEYFNCLGSVITYGAECTWENISRLAIAKAVFNNKKSLFTGKLDLNLTLRRLMSYIYGAPILDVSRSHTTTQHSR